MRTWCKGVLWLSLYGAACGGDGTDATTDAGTADAPASDAAVALTAPEPDYDPQGDYGGPGQDWAEAPWPAGECLAITQGHSGPSHSTLSGCPVDLDDGCEPPGNTEYVCPFDACRIHRPCRAHFSWGLNICVEDVSTGSWQFLGHLMDYGGPAVVDGAIVDRGTVVGWMGNTGNVIGSPGCTGAGTHLHLEVGSPGSAIGGTSVAPPWSFAAGGSVCSTTPGASGRTIKVLSPNGGEVLYKGTDYIVRWTSTAVVVDVRVVVRRNGAELSPPLSTTAAPTGELVFNPPEYWPDAADYELCVTAVDDSITDCSDSAFEIRSVPTGSSITVISPNGGEDYVRGVEYVVSWTSVGVAPPLRAVMRRGGVEMSPPLSTTAPASGTLPFSAPAGWPDANDYEFCVTTPLGTVFDCSDATFSISASTGGGASVEVLTPNGGETFHTDIASPVAWSSSGTAGPMQVVVRKAGSPLDPPVSTDAPTAGALDVSPPASWGTGADYEVCVTSLADGTSDCSDSFFTIENDTSSGCAGLNLLEGETVLLQRADGVPSAYAFGSDVAPAMTNDQVIYQLGYSLPAGELRFCIQYEVLGSTSLYGATAILKGSSPWTDRFRTERWIPPGMYERCYDVPAMSEPFAPTQVAILRSWSDGDGFRVLGAELCEK